MSIGLQVGLLTVPFLLLAAWVLPDPVSRAVIVGFTVALIVAVWWAWVRFRRTEVTASRYGIVETGFLGGVHVVPARSIARIIRLQLYRGASLETSNQLFAVDRDGYCLLRLRGAFWDCESMDEVAAALGVEEEVRPEPVTVSELRRTDARMLYWWERGLRMPGDDGQRR
ncbi:hypothetical protein [Agromyces larvae]|uniref:PH domain-containing protein n=1 Tax=Agromyces larvae TaxID=2929802 RepID=A0ABY4C291_9MICO|nr:hypothetical protein [Agromyces larvae]UOE44266.1 hypothetical protein MTO99_00240 [Agromyces larvae]